MTLTWKDLIYRYLIEHCESKSSNEFTLADFLESYQETLEAYRPTNNTVDATVRRRLQILRDEGLVEFVNNRGAYRLRGIQVEQPNSTVAPLIQALPVKNQEDEYYKEVFSRDKSLVFFARYLFGTKCLCANCSNSFIKDNGQPYIEVHHIHPLCEGGDDDIQNVSVVCAHHHRMAHFSTKRDRDSISHMLRDRTQEILHSRTESREIS